MANDPVRVAADELWKAYLEVLPESERQRDYFEAFQFGAGREMANQLARLVLDGIKTATSDLSGTSTFRASRDGRWATSTWYSTATGCPCA